MAPKKKKSSEPPSESVRLPSVDPVVAARNDQVDKWIYRLQEVNRDATHARRQRGLLTRKLGELEQLLVATNTAAHDLAFAPLRPPPAVPSSTPTAPRQRSRSITKTKGGAAPGGSNAAAIDAELALSQWRPPEPAEARKLTRIANEMLHNYNAPKEGFPSNQVNKKGDKVGGVSGGGILSNSNSKGIYQSPHHQHHPSLLSPTMKHQQRPPSSPTPPPTAADAAAATSTTPPTSSSSPTKKGGGPHSSSVTPRTGANEKSSKSPRTKGDKDGGSNSKRASIVMASMSLAGGGVVAAPLLEENTPPANSKRNNNNKNSPGKKDGIAALQNSNNAKGVAPTVDANGDDPAASNKAGKGYNNGGGMSPFVSGSMNGSMFAEALSLIPYSSVLEKPTNISPVNWEGILRLRVTRIEASERIENIQGSLLKAQARVLVVKERERIAAYSLLAAHRDLLATGCSTRDLSLSLPPAINEKIAAALAEEPFEAVQAAAPPPQSQLSGGGDDVQLPPIGAASPGKAQRTAM